MGSISQGTQRCLVLGKAQYWVPLQYRCFWKKIRAVEWNTFQIKQHLPGLKETQYHKTAHPNKDPLPFLCSRPARSNQSLITLTNPSLVVKATAQTEAPWHVPNAGTARPHPFRTTHFRTVKSLLALYAGGPNSCIDSRLPVRLEVASYLKGKRILRSKPY